ncbi:hypothetical protein PSP31121_05115 [Pandoraea sputorum]|uniref:Uncharacterized protein n=1 Tax=Pandoraea sputorum TaxID=93222 RepID=A0A5E5BJA1_9BURK|nr:hypothetical protein PSP31121_05115 [Pandoraea sputorum]
MRQNEIILGDWELGKPPFRLQVDGWILGCVRWGYSDGVYFRFLDCTHPAQNSAIYLDRVDGWRIRNTA